MAGEELREEGGKEGEGGVSRSGGAAGRSGWEPDEQLALQYRQELIESGLAFGEVDMRVDRAHGAREFAHAFWREIASAGVGRAAVAAAARRTKRVAQELLALAQVC